MCPDHGFVVQQEAFDQTERTFGEILRRLRLDAGLTQEELAERAQLSERAVRRLERDDGTPRLQSVRLLAEALALSEDQRAHLLAAARPTGGREHLSVPSTTLPRSLTPLIGREEDLAILKLLVAERPLVTIRGPGGVGKTRLALAVADQLQGTFQRVGFADLAPLREAREVLGATAGALAIGEQDRVSLLEVIARALQAERTLLVLDNMEHLLAASDTVLELLHLCPTLSILITSREALRVRGERIYTLGPLPLPEREEDTARSPAVRLFVDRALDAGVPLELDEATGELVVNICRRLDGLPLAIELAAAWSPILSLSALLDQLDSRFLNLDSGSRDAPARQRTIHAAIAWSYHLLGADEKVCFRRLAVFADSCSLDAADAVCHGVDLLRTDTLRLLKSLADKSLLTALQMAGDEREPRFRMLETIREFALDQLGASAEVDIARRVHAAYYLALAKTAERALSGPDQSLWLARLEQDHDNLRAVLRRARQSGDLGLVLDLAATLWPFWAARGHFEEARRWLGDVPAESELDGTPVTVRAGFLYAAAALATAVGINERSIELLTSALALARSAADDPVTAKILRVLAIVLTGSGKFPLTERLLQEALSLYRGLEDRAGVCLTLGALGSVARFQGRFDEAVALYHESLELGRAIGDSTHIADMLARLGTLESERGRPSQAAPLFDEAEDLYRQLGNSPGMSDLLLRAGEAAAEAGQYEDAARLLEDSLTGFRQVHNPYSIAWVQLFQASVAVGTGDLTRAEILAGECLEFFRTAGDHRCIADALLLLADVARDRHEHARAQGLARESLAIHRDANTRPQIARCLERMLLLACREYLWERAAKLHGAATALRAEMDAEIAPADRPRYEACLAVIRRELGAAFEGAEVAGRRMELDDAIAYALDEAPMTDTGS